MISLQQTTDFSGCNNNDLITLHQTDSKQKISHKKSESSIKEKSKKINNVDNNDSEHIRIKI